MTRGGDPRRSDGPAERAPDRDAVTADLAAMDGVALAAVLRRVADRLDEVLTPGSVASPGAESPGAESPGAASARERGATARADGPTARAESALASAPASTPPSTPAPAYVSGAARDVVTEVVTLPGARGAGARDAIGLAPVATHPHDAPPTVAVAPSRPDIDRRLESARRKLAARRMARAEASAPSAGPAATRPADDAEGDAARDPKPTVAAPPEASPEGPTRRAWLPSRRRAVRIARYLAWGAAIVAASSVVSLILL